MNPPFWKDRKVVLTGHAGFKGSWLNLTPSNWGWEYNNREVMQTREELLPDTWLYPLPCSRDLRGSFVKTNSQHADILRATGFDLAEEFYSVSRKNVLRGMHFQLPPHDYMKIVSCLKGTVLDVLLDLRKGPGYGQTAQVLLTEERPSLLVIPKGIAHGFRSLSDDSLMLYKTSTVHVPTHDRGIRWDSFGFEWGCETPILSERDRNHPAFTDFTSPF